MRLYIGCNVIKATCNGVACYFSRCPPKKRNERSVDYDMHYITELLQSDTWQDKRRGELLFVDYRCKKLGRYIQMYASGLLPYKPTTPLEMLEKQYEAMCVYRSVLEERSMIEDF